MQRPQDKVIPTYAQDKELGFAPAISPEMFGGAEDHPPKESYPEIRVSFFETGCIADRTSPLLQAGSLDSVSDLLPELLLD